MRLFSRSTRPAEFCISSSAKWASDVPAECWFVRLNRSYLCCRLNRLLQPRIVNDQCVSGWPPFSSSNPAAPALRFGPGMGVRRERHEAYRPVRRDPRRYVRSGSTSGSVSIQNQDDLPKTLQERSPASRASAMRKARLGPRVELEDRIGAIEALAFRSSLPVTSGSPPKCSRTRQSWLPGWCFPKGTTRPNSPSRTSWRWITPAWISIR